jgi:glycosyltransferase involved in cell wall biosynthesis
VRIAYLINQYPKVTHSFIRREILALEQLGFEIMRISLRGWDLDLADDEDRLERARTRYVLNTQWTTLLAVTALMFVRRPIRFIRALTAAARLSRGSNRPLYVHLAYLTEACTIEPWLRKANILHVHAHFGTNSTAVAMLVSILGGPQYSFTIHGPEEFERILALHLIEKIARSVFAVSISRYGQSQLRKAVRPRDRKKIHIVHCGLDASFQTRVEATMLGNQIVCVARLSPEKGHDVLLEAAHQLASRGIDFQLVFVGDGDLRPQIEKVIEKKSLTSRVRITGWLSSQQVRDEILAARALVLSSFAEGLPVVIMEAMALERPVIATVVGGISELVLSGEHGWLVPSGDATALASAIKSCLEASPEAIARMGEAARERVLVRHDAMTEALKLQELFRYATSDHIVCGGKPTIALGNDASIRNQ